MITIREKFLAYVKDYFGTPQPIYTDPTSNEFHELVKEHGGANGLRYIITRHGNQKKVYVAPVDLLHDSMSIFLKIPYPVNTDAIFGEAKFNRGKWTAIDFSFQMHRTLKKLWDSKNLQAIHEILSYDWNNKYIDMHKLIDRLKKEWL